MKIFRCLIINLFSLHHNNIILKSSYIYFKCLYFHHSFLAFERLPDKTITKIKILNMRPLKTFTKIRNCVTQFSQFGIIMTTSNIKRSENIMYLVDYLLAFSCIFFDTFFVVKHASDFAPSSVKYSWFSKFMLPTIKHFPST